MRLTKVSGGTTTSTVPSGSNKVSAVGGTSIVYNSAGAFTSYGSTAYNWNATGQISFISTSGSTVGTYTYNASNQRTKKVAGGNTTHYVYGLGGLLYGEYDGSGNLIREYVYQNGAPLAQIDAGSPEVLTYLHTDHLGTPKYGTNTGGTSVWAASTDPFGVGTPSGSRTVNLRMAGQYYDSESGLFYNWNRYYHPALGRYISSDPIGLAGGPNTFNYANVSPVMFTDPEGLEVQECCRPAEILGGTVDHCWLTTDTKSAGMASSPACRSGVGNNYEYLYSTKVYVSDHSCDNAAACTTVKNVDESCVNNQLDIGRPLGRFSAWNNCQTFSKNVIDSCSIKGTVPPSKDSPVDVYGPPAPPKKSLGEVYGPPAPSGLKR